MQLYLLLSIFCTCVYGQQQDFNDWPKTQTVNKGMSVQLNCGVSNLRGRVQWTRNGLGLGYRRSWPSLPRYSVRGDPSIGEYHLFITNVQLEDDGEFQCQVSPAAGNPALAAAATLTVNIPPESVTIQGKTNGSMLEVNETQREVNLTCVSKGGKPAPVLSWQRQGRILETASFNWTEERPDKLFDSYSVLSMKPRDGDDKKPYTCSSKNAAQPTSLVTTVILSVLHPPGRPVISGRPDSVINTGRTLQIKCVAKGGNPSPVVYWYKNGQGVDHSFKRSGDLVTNILNFTVAPDDNNAVYSCQTYNNVNQKTPNIESFKLTVRFAPKELFIEGKMDVKAGERVNLTCTTDISNPQAVITWLRRGQEIQTATQTSWESPRGGWITKSTISVVVTERESNVDYTCSAFNEFIGNNFERVVTLRVLYPPDPPKIVVSLVKPPAIAGEKIRLVCTTNGGNPVPSLKIFKGDTWISSLRGGSGTFHQATSEFLLKANDNGAIYSCNASNDATPVPLVDSIKLEVHFPPDSVKVYTNPAQVIAGQRAQIICNSSSSYPSSKVSFEKDSKIIPSKFGRYTPSVYDGNSTTQILDINPTWKDDGEIYACLATNDLIEKAVSDAINLNVLYKPVFPETYPSEVKVIDESSFLLNMTAFGNPSNITYWWYKGSDKIVFTAPSTRRRRDIRVRAFSLLDNGAILNMSLVGQDHSGSYAVQAANEIGVARFNFRINVLFPPVIAKPPRLDVNMKQKVELKCKIKANPLLKEHVTWLRHGYDFSKTTQELKDGVAILTIPSVAKNDTGEFTCLVNNTIGDTQQQTAVLVVKFTPDIDKGSRYTNAAASPDRGQSAELICRAEGAPKISFTWSLKNSLGLAEELRSSTVNDTFLKYKISHDEVKEYIIYYSYLTVYNVTRADYARYQCKASNILGYDSADITLSGRRRPDPPENLRLLNKTYNSILLQWTPGFGGLAKGSAWKTQKFQVAYHIETSNLKSYQDVAPTMLINSREPLTVTHDVIGLQPNTKYVLTVRGKNDLGFGDFAENTITATTNHAPAASTGDGDVPLIIILVVCIIGMILLGLNVLLILFFIRRRRRNLEKEGSETMSHTNTVEMISGRTGTDDSRSYSTYEKRSIDDYDDDYKRYEDDDEVRRIIPSRQTPLYPTQPVYGNLGSSYTPPPGAPGMPYGSLPRGTGAPGAPPDEDDYADQLRRMQMGVGVYDSQGRLSRSEGKLTPLPPTRTVSQDPYDADPYGKPPIPSRNYDYSDIPRYAPPPDSQRGHLV